MSDETRAPVLLRMPVELRWRDLDAFNHVNNSTFMTYLEEARIRWFETLGEAWVTPEAVPLLAAVQMNYRRPIPYPSKIVVELTAGRLGTSSATIGHRILAAASDEVHADGHVVMVWVERDSGRPCALPDVVRRVMERSAGAGAPGEAGA
jgi:acyl-CoA thioester hydrolase